MLRALSLAAPPGAGAAYRHAMAGWTDAYSRSTERKSNGF